MKLCEPGYKILSDISHSPLYGFEEAPGVTTIGPLPNLEAADELHLIENAARTCYKSEDRMTVDNSSAKKMIAKLIESGHEAMLEHSSLTVKFVTDRAIANELVRHRLAAYAQESTRYCNYSKDKFGGEITVVRPGYLVPGTTGYNTWYLHCCDAERSYFSLLDFGLTPQEARIVLPLCLKTEIVVTANYREWRHIFKLRTAPDAHPEIRRLLTPLLVELKQRIPVIFDDIEAD